LAQGDGHESREVQDGADRGWGGLCWRGVDRGCWSAGAEFADSEEADLSGDRSGRPADIRAALAEARRTHKRVILDFGGDWCPDCQVLNIYFHQSPNAELVAKYFILVDVNIGRMDANLDIAHKYGIPLTGVPALAVVDGDGKVVYAQNQEFSDMRHLESSALTAFLNQWKP
jgi:thiol:disulfide interchange protein